MAAQEARAVSADPVETVALLGKLGKRGLVTINARTFSLASMNAIVAAHEPDGRVRVLMPAQVARAHGLLVQTQG